MRISVDEISAKTGVKRETVIAVVRELEDLGLLTASRAHRQTTVYGLDLAVLLDPWVGKADSKQEIRVGKTDSKRDFRVGNPDPNTPLESEKPTQNGTFESGFPTPIKEKNKAAAAVPILKPHKPPDDPNEADVLELQRISEATGIRIDGKDALSLKAGTESAGLSLAHLRWYLADEKFASARSPRAVLLTIAREFRERSKGIRWPTSLDPPAPSRSQGLTREELLNL